MSQAKRRISMNVPPLCAQNRNRHGANDSVAVGPQVTAIRVAPGNQQIRLRLHRSLTQHLGHVTTADEYIGLDAVSCWSLAICWEALLTSSSFHL